MEEMKRRRGGGIKKRVTLRKVAERWREREGEIEGGGGWRGKEEREREKEIVREERGV